MSQTAFQYDAAMSAKMLEYGNCQKSMIADCVLPMVKVCSPAFKYRAFDKAAPYSRVDDKVGRTSQVHEIQQLASSLVASAVEDYSLEIVIPKADTLAESCGPCSNIGYDIEEKNAQHVMRILMLNREFRAAQLVGTAANYAAGNVTTLAAALQFNNASTSTPIATIQTIMDSMIQRPNVIWMGREVASALSRHPEIRGNFFGAGQGLSSEQQLAQMFGVDKVCVADGFKNTAAIGQAPVYSRIWGKQMGFLVLNQEVSSTDCPLATFGYTASLQSGPEVMKYFDPTVGARGGDRIRVILPAKELIVDNSLGSIITNAVA